MGHVITAKVSRLFSRGDTEKTWQGAAMTPGIKKTKGM